MYFPSLTYFHQSGGTALMCAAEGGHSEVAKVLLDAGASIEAKSNVSKTIFIFKYLCVCVRGEGYSSIIMYDMIMSLLWIIHYNDDNSFCFWFNDNYFSASFLSY